MSTDNCDCYGMLEEAFLGGNHHIEGAQCGLPVLYINSGGIPEYCDGYGVMFEKNNFEEKLNELANNYLDYYEAMKSYELDSEKMNVNS